jgi:1,4-alpha-glucan branching enzyme
MFARALAEGFVYQGELSAQTGKPRGVACAAQPPQFFVDFIQNHDQTGNRAQGERLISLAGAGKTRVLLAALLLSPHIPLLFMGEEFGESNPFCSLPIFRVPSRRRCGKGGQKSLPDTRGTTNPSRTRTIP